MDWRFAYTHGWFVMLACCVLPNASWANQDTEPNDDFAHAVPISLDNDGVATVCGTIHTWDDIDIYSLGGVVNGDRIVLTIEASGSWLDPVATIFYTDGRLVGYNDDFVGPSGSLDAQLDEIIRFCDGTYFLGVASSPYAPFGAETGSYQLSVVRMSDVAAPNPQLQFVVLDFDGAAASSSGFPPRDVPVFSAAAIHPMYAGDDEVIVDSVVSTIRSNLAEFNTVIISGAELPPPGNDVSTIYFGGFNASAWAIAEGIDPYNTNASDASIVFTEAFGPFQFSKAPTPGEIGVAIGNVASNTLGHLLGLYGVRDASALMDGSATADSLLTDRVFMAADLGPGVFPIGIQDAPMLLGATVGFVGDANGDMDFDLRDYVALQGLSI